MKLEWCKINGTGRPNEYSQTLLELIETHETDSKSRQVAKEKYSVRLEVPPRS